MSRGGNQTNPDKCLAMSGYFTDSKATNNARNRRPCRAPLRRFPPPWSIRRIRSVLPPSATTRFNPRANNVSDYGWGDGIGAGEDEGVTGLGLWAWAYPFGR